MLSTGVMARAGGRGEVLGAMGQGGTNAPGGRGVLGEEGGESPLPAGASTGFLLARYRQAVGWKPWSVRVYWNDPVMPPGTDVLEVYGCFM